MVKISPSILTVDSKDIENEVKNLELAGVDFIHLDVMDGKFVKNKTDGIDMLNKTKFSTNLPIDTHLMIESPLEHIDEYMGSSIITFHIEAVKENELLKTISYIKSKGIKVGVSLKPNTPLYEIISIIKEIDMILVMTVEPGLGGQKLIPETLEKVRQIKKLYPNILVEVDGGINLENIEEVKNAGADIIVAGTAIINASDRKEIIHKMKA